MIYIFIFALSAGTPLRWLSVYWPPVQDLLARQVQRPGPSDKNKPPHRERVLDPSQPPARVVWLRQDIGRTITEWPTGWGLCINIQWIVIGIIKRLVTIIISFELKGYCNYQHSLVNDQYGYFCALRLQTNCGAIGIFILWTLIKKHQYLKGWGRKIGRELGLVPYRMI